MVHKNERGCTFEAKSVVFALIVYWFYFIIYYFFL